MKPSPYDSHHVTLNLIQEMHSRIMTQEASIETERELRREEMKKANANLRESGQLRRELDELKQASLISFEEQRRENDSYRATLEEIAEMKSKGGELARKCLFHWPRPDGWSGDGEPD